MKLRFSFAVAIVLPFLATIAAGADDRREVRPAVDPSGGPPVPAACIPQWKYCDPKKGDPCCAGLTCRAPRDGWGDYECRSPND